jgi:putative pyruvate formate lyase activating enzyme
MNADCANTISLDELRECTLCPRECHADRMTNRLGYCQTGTGFRIGAICLHRGEEPIISGKQGICNVFFTRCNMQCLYCQNFQISRNRGPIHEEDLSLEKVVERIETLLDQGASAVGFVSPSHVIPQMKAIITALRQGGKTPVFVMNTNGYDKVETLASLEGFIDVYLPDLKYMDERLAAQFSDTPNYPHVAGAALKEMFRQKGETVTLDERGVIRSGLVIRHLVLPGFTENSKSCLQFIARELSPHVYLSVMAQYTPTEAVTSHRSLKRPLHSDEYEEVLDEMDRLGFHFGFTQELGSQKIYRPNFFRPDPFRQRPSL